MEERKIIPSTTIDELAVAQARKNGMREEQPEDWRVVIIEDTPSHYIVSDSGRVVNYTSGLDIALKDKGNGYPFCSLYKDGKIHNCLAHRLVALAFLYNDAPEVKDTVNHINHIRNDNRLSNLEWMSRADNARDGNLKYDLRAESIREKDKQQIELFKERLEPFLDKKIFAKDYGDVADTFKLANKNSQCAKFKTIRDLATLIGYQATKGL